MWVLIIIYQGIYWRFGFADHVEFSSEKSCIVARDAVKKKLAGRYDIADCFKKD